MSYIADDIVCDAPNGRLVGVAAVRNFIEPFAKMLTGSKLLAVFGDNDAALIMYDTDSPIAKRFPGADYLTVKNGKITYTRVVFDQTPMKAQASEQGAKTAP
jgi:hypothetical protein